MDNEFRVLHIRASRLNSDFLYHGIPEFNSGSLVQSLHDRISDYLQMEILSIRTVLFSSFYSVLRRIHIAIVVACCES